MIKKIEEDLFRINGEQFSSHSFLRAWRSKGFKYLFFLRLKGYSSLWLVRFLAGVFLRHYTYKYGFQIPVQTKIGGGLFIGHFGSVVISANAEIGRNCNIAHNVTIGAARGKRAGAPKIGDNVWIGTGAVIVGNIQIGNSVLISPNAFVNIDVPDNSVVIGNPAIIIRKDNPVLHYINNICKS